MIVCHCHGIDHRRILKVVRDGCRTPGEVMQECAAGRGCGGCVDTVVELIDEVKAEERCARLGTAGSPSEAPASAQGFIGM